MRDLARIKRPLVIRGFSRDLYKYVDNPVASDVIGKVEDNINIRGIMDSSQHLLILARTTEL